MTNLLANELYKEVIVPTEIQNNMPVDDRKVQYFNFKNYIVFFTKFFYVFRGQLEYFAEKKLLLAVFRSKNILK